jgi:hypothetical protein
MLDASVCLSTCVCMLTKPIQKLHNVTKNFISYRFCMSIFLPAYLQERGKHQRFPCCSPHTRTQIQLQATGPQTWYPKLGRVFLVSVRGVRRYHINAVHLFPPAHSFLFNQSNFEARSSAKEQRKRKKKLWTEREIQYSFSSLSHFSLTLVLIPPYLSLFVYRVRLSDESDCDL